MSSSQEAVQDSSIGEQTTLVESETVTPPEKVIGKTVGSMYRVNGPGVPLGVHIYIAQVRPAESWERNPEQGTASQVNDASDVWVEAYYSPINGIVNGDIDTEGDPEDPSDDGTERFAGVAELLLEEKVDFMPDGPSADINWYDVEVARR
jgi:hypothetical protein